MGCFNTHGPPSYTKPKATRRKLLWALRAAYKRMRLQADTVDARRYWRNCTNFIRLESQARWMVQRKLNRLIPVLNTAMIASHEQAVAAQNILTLHAVNSLHQHTLLEIIGIVHEPLLASTFAEIAMRARELSRNAARVTDAADEVALAIDQHGAIVASFYSQ